MKILGKYIKDKAGYDLLRKGHKDKTNIYGVAAIVTEFTTLIMNFAIADLTQSESNVGSVISSVIVTVVRFAVYIIFFSSACQKDDITDSGQNRILSRGFVIFLFIFFCLSTVGSVISIIYGIIVRGLGNYGAGFVAYILCSAIKFFSFIYLARFCIVWLCWWQWTWEELHLSPEERAKINHKYIKPKRKNNTHNGGKEIMNGDIGKTVTGLLRKALMENIITETQFEEFTNRLEALDRLRAKCYITREEYERKANLILDDVLTIISKSEWRSGRICGTKALEIYDECCELFGWKRSLRGEFGPQRRLWAGKATPENYDVWFVSRSNINGANNDSWNNTVDNARGTITVDWHIPFEGVAGTRVTFVKNREGQYVFYGVYSCTLDYSARREICTRISDRYPE